MLFQVLEHLIHMRIAPFINQQFHPSQGGFRWGADALVGSLINVLSLRASTHTFVAFVDIEKVFDTAPSQIGRRLVRTMARLWHCSRESFVAAPFQPCCGWTRSRSASCLSWSPPASMRRSVHSSIFSLMTWSLPLSHHLTSRLPSMPSLSGVFDSVSDLVLVPPNQRLWCLGPEAVFQNVTSSWAE